MQNHQIEHGHYEKEKGVKEIERERKKEQATQLECLELTYLSKFDNVSIIVRDNREINTIARQCSNPYSVIVVLSCFYRIKRT